jgi:hypothetical protein
MTAMPVVKPVGHRVGMNMMNLPSPAKPHGH